MRWTAYLLVAALFATACVFLARWQFDRNEWRAGQIALVEQNYDAPAVALDTLIGPDGAFDPGDEWRPVRLVGQYAIDDELLVRNRPHGGTRAFEVLVPLHLDTGEIVIVNRGWVTPGRDDLPDTVPAPALGTVEVIVRLRPGEPLPQSGRSAPAGQVPTLNLPLVAETTGSATFTAFYGELASETPAAEALGALPKPTEDPGPHLSYAIQWILFAVMGFVFIWYIIRTENQRRGEEVEKTPRRRDRDADAEDALLDA